MIGERLALARRPKKTAAAIMVTERTRYMLCQGTEAGSASLLVFIQNIQTCWVQMPYLDIRAPVEPILFPFACP